ncbi:MAG: hypothetical protein FNP40_06540 [Dehalobacter sp. 4CP]|uniref:hypothetical protein n=1 Tax=Dehalobacter sp. CP TaxID=2594474 RepID=UPI0013C90DC6|nr:hypothetical protein [Dehalobacter sp. 4CP]
MSFQDVCSICGNQAKVVGLGPLDQYHNVDCEVCGSYSISDIARDYVCEDKNTQQHRVKLSSFLRERTIKNLEKITVVVEDKDGQPVPRITIEGIVEAFPKNLADRIDRALLNLALLSKFAGDKVKLNEKDYSIFCPDSIRIDATFFIMEQLISEDYVKGHQGFPTELIVTSKGWNRVADLQRTVNKESKQGFVAMWFDSSMDLVWKKAIQKAITDAGFTPRRIDNKEHNNKICDEIIAEIRNSKFVVCDFTGQRGGVYFEAGFALGLGLPVIWTCKSNEVDKLHFDTRQYNHIVWDEEEDLYTKLFNRIKATII